jgi:hypothetical protein
MKLNKMINSDLSCLFFSMKLSACLLITCDPLNSINQADQFQFCVSHRLDTAFGSAWKNLESAKSEPAFLLDELAALKVATESLSEGKLNLNIEAYLKLASTCIAQDAIGVEQKPSKCLGDFSAHFPFSLRIPLDPALEIHGRRCSEACSFPVDFDMFTYESVSAVKSSEAECRRCLIAMFGTCNSGTGHYPSTIDLKAMVKKSDILGRASCLRESTSDDCRDYVN